ncbi:hypothetical protein NH340_JMT05618 [Sarcoptes scabiei]|nr:hypothetical protein NH340_JMT05618 [Sarcoptes scabiei]
MNLLEQNKSIIFNQEFTPSLFDISVGESGISDYWWLNEQYSLLYVVFVFERRIIHSLLTVYIPSSLIVTLSWLQFWFDVEAVPGRMSLGIMSTLTIMTQILTNYEKAGNHVTAVDIWLFVCLIMVFLALMEYALAYTISHYYDDFDDEYEDKFSIEKCENINTTETIKGEHSDFVDTATNTRGFVASNRINSLRKQTDIAKEETTKNEFDEKRNHLESNESNTLDGTASNDRFIEIQRQILSLSQELETLLNAKYYDTMNSIHSARKTISSTHKMQSLLAGGQSARISAFDRNKTDDENNFKNKMKFCQQRNKNEPNRLSRFRQSLRRQLSTRSLRAGGGPHRIHSGMDGGGGRSKLSEVDYCSRYLFPFAFVLFATAYWIALIYYKLN